MTNLNSFPKQIEQFCRKAECVTNEQPTAFFSPKVWQLVKISDHADGGPRSRVCARKTLRSAPHRRERKFSGARVCRVTFKHLPQPLKSHIRSFGTLGQILKFSKKT